MAHKPVVSRGRGRLQPLDLVATTVHELKTPLTLITGLANMLETGHFGKLKPQQNKYVARITATGERLINLVESLLVLSKAQQRQTSVRLQPVAVVSVVQDVLDELEPALSHHKMSVNWQRRRGLAPVLAERGSLRQIVYNLLDNAIKYSPAGSTITIKFRHQNGWLYLRISDQGLGIKPTELKQLFRRFGRIERPLRSQAGSTGLGLFIVKSLVQAHGGKVRAQSLSRGTCFIVQLPLAQQLNLFKATRKRS